MFTDIAAAIEEARFLRQQTKHHHCITQHKDGEMKVRQEASAKRESLLRKLYTTRNDRMGMVNPDGAIG